MPPAYRPLLNFMIIGAQKCGTTALAHFLGQHPQIRMSTEKEPHLFDAQEYSAQWTPQQIDQRYLAFFTASSIEGTSGTPAFAEAPDHDLVRGEATPIYLFLPEIAPELKRYNPDLKMIVLLRDPVQRAISHYYMEKNKNYEPLPLWLAMLSESWRLWRCRGRLRRGSAWRRHSYRRRGLYSRQLTNLYRHFDQGQVLLMRTDDLARHHEAALQRVFDFLGVRPHAGIEARTIFAGERGYRRHSVVSRLLRLSYLPEFARMRRFRISSISA